jgi:hypothetical protein
MRAGEEQDFTQRREGAKEKNLLAHFPYFFAPSRLCVSYLLFADVNKGSR